MLCRCFHCARLESKYWNSVSTFGALLHFQYHSCEEIVYFSRDFSTTFIQYIKQTDFGATGVIAMLSLCRTWIEVLKFSLHLWVTAVSVPQIVYFSRDFSTISFNASIIMKSHRANRCYPDAFIVQDLNRCTEIQYTLLGHFFSFSTTAVKR